MPENTLVKNANLFGIFFVFVTTLYLSVFMGTSIVKKLRQRESELIALKDALEVQANQLKESNLKLEEIGRAHV